MAAPIMFQPLVKYVDLQGRARRSEYWLFFLFQIIVAVALSVPGEFVPGLEKPFELANNLFSLVVFLPTIAVAVRRFHDVNRTGWWLFLPGGVLILSGAIYFILQSADFMKAMAEIDMKSVEAGDVAAATALLSAIGPLFLWIVLPTWVASLVTFVFHVTDGTVGANRFGSDPKGRGGSVNVF